MKNLFSLFVSVFVAFAATAQNPNLTIFTEEGETFTLIIDEKVYNETPSQRVSVFVVPGKQHEAFIQFEEDSSKSFYSLVGTEPGESTTFLVSKTKRGKYRCRYHHSEPYSGAKPPTQRSIDRQGPSEGSAQPAPVMPEININVNVNTADSRERRQTRQRNENQRRERTSQPQEEAPTTNGPLVEVEEETCFAMENTAFEAALKSIETKSFESTRLSQAKMVVQNNCLSTQQIIRVMGVFSFEDTKLEFAKHAWSRTTDPQNYFLVNDSFSFSSSVTKLNEFLSEK